MPRIYELTELLVDWMGLEDVGASFTHRVTYHASRHGLRNLQLGDKPLRLLRKVQGMELLELQDAERYCGLGGIFAVKNAEVSTGHAVRKSRLDIGYESRGLHCLRQFLSDAH